MKIDPVRENRTFLRAYKKGKKYAGKYCVIYVLPKKTGALRLGLTVTKARGGSVLRCRIRRILRAAWYDVFSHHTGAGPFDVVIVARDAAACARSTDISPELEAGLLSLGVISAV